MDVSFGTVDIDVLNKVCEIAKEHDCNVYFGAYSTLKTNVSDVMDICSDTIDERITKYIAQCDLLESLAGTKSRFWFQLYEKKTGAYNILTYLEENYELVFNQYEIDYTTDCEYSYTERSEEYIKFCEWLTDTMPSWETILRVQGELKVYIEDRNTVITGFDTLDKSKYNVYRPGITLKVFADLVCDYLGEERIKIVL